ncbi:uncharacterized protein F4822DRAFT_429675 [Hypoxylon trugodes]|uniref:uncharacterized protein n=1 Tax=Hypoxylon trugodes TaxID=326681 RepID=UPI002191C524|nr:uncharacterized protein F4822DRAFT_429675 [Hypoxylon trugodes]KAI1389064.1 hypothetical protein F4822DRAFT_429675 [Hypoxylon trugodes]
MSNFKFYLILLICAYVLGLVVYIFCDCARAAWNAVLDEIRRQRESAQQFTGNTTRKHGSSSNRVSNNQDPSRVQHSSSAQGPRDEYICPQIFQSEMTVIDGNLTYTVHIRGNTQI